MSTINKVTLTTPEGVIDVEFVGGGVVTITRRKSATSKAVIGAVETLAPKPEFAKGRGTFVAALMTTIANDRDLDTLGVVTF